MKTEENLRDLLIQSELYHQEALKLKRMKEAVGRQSELLERTREDLRDAYYLSYDGELVVSGHVIISGNCNGQVNIQVAEVVI